MQVSPAIINAEDIVSPNWFYASMYLLSIAILIHLGKNGKQPGQAIAATLMGLLYTAVMIFVLKLQYRVKHDMAIPTNPKGSGLESQLERN